MSRPTGNAPQMGRLAILAVIALLASAVPSPAQVRSVAVEEPGKLQADNPFRIEFALPAGRPNLFPLRMGAAGSSSSVPATSHESLGTATPNAELLLGYLFTRLNPGNGVDALNTHGGIGSLAFNLNPRWGLVADLTGSTYARDIGVMKQDGRTISYLFGPRFSWRNWQRVVPFVQTLVGGFRLSEGGSNENSFAWTLGGGLDVVASPYIGFRLFQAEYLLTNLRETAGSRDIQNNLRFGTGIVFRLGVPKPAVPATNHPPAVQCSASPSSAYAGQVTTVAVQADADDPDGDSLTHSWTAKQGKLDGSGSIVRWTNEGLSAGQYAVGVRVSDGRGGTASCETTILLEPQPNQTPTLTCSANRTSVLAGERITISGTAQDPDGDPLEYIWRASAGQVVGAGSSIQLDTTGLTAGRYRMTGRVEDSRGGAADCEVVVDVIEPPPPPQPSKINECHFRPGSARVDNVCKRILDDVALRLNHDPGARLALVGYADPNEPRATALGPERVAQVARYLGEKGIGDSRLERRTASGQVGGDKQNRRLDMIWLPAGASF